jgi:hypothetical protein
VRKGQIQEPKEPKEPKEAKVLKELKELNKRQLGHKALKVR